MKKMTEKEREQKEKEHWINSKFESPVLSIIVCKKGWVR